MDAVQIDNMEKAYRDLFDRVADQAANVQSLAALVQDIGAIDDLSPLQIPALRAMKMKRDSQAIIGLVYCLEPQITSCSLLLGAYNRSRRRRAMKPAICARLATPNWVYDASAAFPGRDGNDRIAYLELIQQSFGYLHTRISQYFKVEQENTLVIDGVLAVALRIAEQPTARTPHPTL